MSRYLGPEPSKTIALIRSRAPGWFSLVEDTAQFCSDLLSEIDIDPDNGQQVIGAILFRRTLSTFEAVVLTAERGMHTEGLVLRRSMLEALFVLGAIWLQPDLVRTYVLNDQHRRRDIYKNLRKASHESRQRVSQWITDAELEENISELTQATKGTRYLSIEQFAQAAKLHDLYLTDYCLLSEAAHHVAKDLERLVTVSQRNEMEGIAWGPEVEPASSLLFPATDQMLKAAQAASKIFGLDRSEKLRIMRIRAHM